MGVILSVIVGFLLGILTMGGLFFFLMKDMVEKYNEIVREIG